MERVRGRIRVGNRFRDPFGREAGTQDGLADEIDRVGLIEEEPGLLVGDEDRVLAGNGEACPCQLISDAPRQLYAPLDAVAFTSRRCRARRGMPSRFPP